MFRLDSPEDLFPPNEVPNGRTLDVNPTMVLQVEENMFYSTSTLQQVTTCDL